MALKTKTDLTALEVLFKAAVFNAVVANGSTDTTLDVVYKGMPMLATGGAAAPPPAPSPGSLPNFFMAF